MRGCCFFYVVVIGALCAGCPPPYEKPRSIFDGLLKHEEQRQALCARGRDNGVTAVFCDEDDVNRAPDVTSLAELQKLLSLSFDGSEPRPGFALTGNSSSLAARSVSALNPRAVFAELADQRADGNAMGMGYVRGDQLVEFATLPNAGDGAQGRELAFYLLHYEQDCNDADDAAGACGPNDLLTPATEEGWRRWSLYDDVDLKNTVVDCLQCHQPDGLSGQRLFRMQELQNPWTHWFAAFTDGGAVLLDDYRSAHGVDEVYAGIPGRLVAQSNPILVEALVKRTISDQINLFPSPDIEAEVVASSPGQPDDNSVPGESASWQLLYDAAVAGEAIPPPYHDVKITDQRKLLDATAAYNDFVEGAALDVDIRDVVDDNALRDLSFRPKAGLDGAGILLHACGQCHNSRLDPTLTRARFDATRLDVMTRDEKQRAIDRLKLDDDDPLLMPPRLFRELSDDEIQKVVRALR